VDRSRVPSQSRNETAVSRVNFFLLVVSAASTYLRSNPLIICSKIVATSMGGAEHPTLPFRPVAVMRACTQTRLHAT
jgi:hypothetical protein